MALRGHCSIQGSTDIPTLYNMLPTYLPQPNAYLPHETLHEFLEAETVPTGWWHNLPAYMISLLKAWYGAHAQPENDFGYDHLPKLTGDHSQLPMTLAMVEGVVKGQFVLGQNPVVGAVNSDLVQRGLAKLDWLVVRDFAMTETANFWQKGSLVQKGELAPGDIATEVFFFPSAMAAEKEGTMTNTTRLVQWHDKVCDPPGDSRSDLWFIYHLGRRLKQLYADSAEPRDRGDPGADLGLSGQRRYRGARCRRRPARDQRLHRRRSQAGRELPGHQGRRQHGMRRLDVLRGSFPTSTTTARARADRTAPADPAAIRAGLLHGRTIAARCTTALRPTPTEALVGAQADGVVGRRRRRMDRHRHAGFRADQTARHAARLEQAAERHGCARRR